MPEITIVQPPPVSRLLSGETFAFPGGYRVAAVPSGSGQRTGKQNRTAGWPAVVRVRGPGLESGGVEAGAPAFTRKRTGIQGCDTQRMVFQLGENGGAVLNRAGVSSPCRWPNAENFHLGAGLVKARRV